VNDEHRYQLPEEAALESPPPESIVALAERYGYPNGITLFLKVRLRDELASEVKGLEQRRMERRG
jgi:hypothetical protein